ncbi:MAG: hypothetical protein RSE64_08505 [Oscillospiraceae bacterium]
MSTIVSVNYKSKYSDAFGGKAYSYFCDIPVKPGDIVLAPTAAGSSLAQIVEVDVPESRIDERILPLLKTITEREAAPNENH